MRALSSDDDVSKTRGLELGQQLIVMNVLLVGMIRIKRVCSLTHHSSW